MQLKRFGPYVWNRLFHRKFSFLSYLGSWRSTNPGQLYESTHLDNLCILHILILSVTLIGACFLIFFFHFNFP